MRHVARNRSVLAALAVTAGVLLAACGQADQGASEMEAHSSTPASAVASAPASAGGDMSEPSGEGEAASDMHGDEAAGAHGEDDHEHHHGDDPGTGLEATMGGMTLALGQDSVPGGSSAALTFTILGEDGSPVTQFDDDMTKKMHIIVVDSSLSTYQHLHPDMDEKGTWMLALPQLEDGTYRMVADFIPTGHDRVVVGEDFVVGAGGDAPASLKESRISEVDGYRAELVGDTAHEAKSPLKMTITKGGKPVTEVEPYLGTSAHFVAFRGEDLSYVHVHPNSDSIDAEGSIGFTAPPMDHGMWKAFVQVKLDGQLRTFEFSFDGK